MMCLGTGERGMCASMSFNHNTDQNEPSMCRRKRWSLSCNKRAAAVLWKKGFREDLLALVLDLEECHPIDGVKLFVFAILCCAGYMLLILRFIAFLRLLSCCGTRIHEAIGYNYSSSLVVVASVSLTVLSLWDASFFHVRSCATMNLP